MKRVHTSGVVCTTPSITDVGSATYDVGTMGDGDLYDVRSQEDALGEAMYGTAQSTKVDGLATYDTAQSTKVDGLATYDTAQSLNMGQATYDTAQALCTSPTFQLTADSKMLRMKSTRRANPLYTASTIETTRAQLNPLFTSANQSVGMYDVEPDDATATGGDGGFVLPLPHHPRPPATPSPSRYPITLACHMLETLDACLLDLQYAASWNCGGFKHCGGGGRGFRHCGGGGRGLLTLWWWRKGV